MYRRVCYLHATTNGAENAMSLSDAFYVAIPLTNSVGNILLKLSIGERERRNKSRFLLMQLLGYSTFIVVVFFSYLFLLSHDANFFVIIFSLNYLATLYVSRWFLKERFTLRDVKYDLVVVVGIVVFYLGGNT